MDFSATRRIDTRIWSAVAAVHVFKTNNRFSLSVIILTTDVEGWAAAFNDSHPELVVEFHSNLPLRGPVAERKKKDTPSLLFAIEIENESLRSGSCLFAGVPFSPFILYYIFFIWRKDGWEVKSYTVGKEWRKELPSVIRSYRTKVCVINSGIVKFGVNSCFSCRVRGKGGWVGEKWKQQQQKKTFSKSSRVILRFDFCTIFANT